MSNNEHLEAIRDCIRRAQYPQQIGPRKQTEERDLYYATILRHANALATELAEAEARIVRTESLLFANWGVNGTMDITPAMERTLHYARTGEQLGEVDPWPHLDDDGNPIRDATERPEHAPERP